MSSAYDNPADHDNWMKYIRTVDLRHQTERGNAFTASGRWTMAAGAVEYLEFRIGAGKQVRAYDRSVAVDGDPFQIDLCSVTAITAGNTQLAHTNMRLGFTDPDSRIWRGASSPVGLAVKEFSFLPAQRGPQSAGGTAPSQAYRLITPTTVPSILRITNTGDQSHTVNLIILFTEVPA